MQNFIRTAVISCLSVQIIITAAPNSCAPVTNERRMKLAHFVHDQFRLPDSVTVVVATMTEADRNCYRSITFRTSDQYTRFEVSLLLTPDQKMLVRDAFDTDAVPGKLDRMAWQPDVFRWELGLGREFSRDGSVEIVVFSDFQCSACRQLASTLKNIQSEIPTVPLRLVYRNFPITTHSWAQTAAAYASCVKLQSEDGFWRVHDYLFEHQPEITVQNLQRGLLGFLDTLPDVRAENVDQCVKRGDVVATIERDRLLARSNSVHGTPTTYINGFRIEGAISREQLLTAIREAAGEGRTDALEQHLP